MQRCQFCGTELPEQADFCGNCGSMVRTLPSMQSQDTPTAISDVSLPTALRQGSKQREDSILWGWSDDQDVLNSQLLADRQQANLIAVVARGSNIDLYVNQQYLTSMQDGSYSQGQIGLEAEDHGVPAEVMFRNAKVWTL